MSHLCTTPLEHSVKICIRQFAAEKVEYFVHTWPADGDSELVAHRVGGGIIPENRRKPAQDCSIDNRNLKPDTHHVASAAIGARDRMLRVRHGANFRRRGRTSEEAGIS